VAIKINPGGGYNDMGMPLEETKETFTYFLSEVDKLGLAYVTLVRYSYTLDVAKRGTPHDVVATYGHLITRPRTKLWANSEYTPEEAAKAVADGQLDGVFFGFLWLTHPDVAKRIQHGKPLDGVPNMYGIYNHDGTPESMAKGYTDYPAADYN
jgi:2,4-dienoyl-CoA reductase-like NADH-dependent reductase (Old Yellow Enzyme family)